MCKTIENIIEKYEKFERINVNRQKILNKDRREQINNIKTTKR